MFIIKSDKSIHLTRGDVAVIDISAADPNGGNYVFQRGDVIRFRLFNKKDMSQVIVQKDVAVTSATTVVTLTLSKEDTKIGDFIYKPEDYWYEVELNPETAPQTIIGYDEAGPKVFRLYPEGADMYV